MKNKIKVINFLIKKVFFLISTTITFVCMSLANAETPNVWSYEYGQGGNLFRIYDKKNQSLEISCGELAGGYVELFFDAYNNEVNWDSPKDEYDKYLKKSKILNKRISLKINGKEQSIPRNKQSKNYNAAWKSLTSNIKKANKIEVIENGKTIASYFPTFSSMKNIKEVEICIPENFS